MADVNLPSFSDLSQMQFMAPLQRQAAAQQIDLANQFQQQNLNLGDADLQAKLLSNDYSRQADPLRVQQLTLNNTGLGYGNTKSRVEAENMAANQPDLADAAKWEARKKATDAQLEYMQSTAGKMMYSDDPATRAQGNELWQRSQKFQEQKIKDENEVKKYQAMGGFRLQQEEKKQEGANQRSQAEIEAKLQISNDKLAAFKAKMAQAKDPKSYQEGAVTARMHANTAPNAAEAQYWNGVADDLDKRATTFETFKGGQPNKADVGQFGMAKNNPQMPAAQLWQAPPAPWQQPTPAAPAGAAPANTTTNAAGHVAVPPSAQAARDQSAADDLVTTIRRNQAMIEATNDPLDKQRLQQDNIGLAAQLQRLPKTASAGAVQRTTNSQPAPTYTGTNNGPIKADGTVSAGQTKPSSSPATLPQGSKLIGTSGGKPVYETPDGQRFLGK